MSERDKGLYDAFNKGMMLASGKFIGIINSDDVYTKNSLKIISNYINKYKNIDFIFGSVKKHWEFYMVIDQKKYIIVGVFIQVTQQVFF